MGWEPQRSSIQPPPSIQPRLSGFPNTTTTARTGSILPANPSQSRATLERMAPAAEEERTVLVPAPSFFQPAPPGPQGTTANHGGTPVDQTAGTAANQEGTLANQTAANQGGTPASGTAANQQGTPANQAGTPNVTPLAPATGGEPLTSQPLAIAAEPIIEGDSFDEDDSDAVTINAGPRTNATSSLERERAITRILETQYSVEGITTYDYVAQITFLITRSACSNDDIAAQIFRVISQKTALVQFPTPQTLHYDLAQPRIMCTFTCNVFGPLKRTTENSGFFENEYNSPFFGYSNNSMNTAMTFVITIVGDLPRFERLFQ
jgi:hypothetical protein